MGKPEKPTVERVEADGVWCLVVRDAHGMRAFLDHCSHKQIPLGPKVALKKGCLRCPHHDVRFDCGTGKVSDANGKKVPEGLVPVSVTAGPGGEPRVMIEARHREYLAARRAGSDKRRKKKESSRGRHEHSNHTGKNDDTG